MQRHVHDEFHRVIRLGAEQAAERGVEVAPSNGPAKDVFNDN